MASIQFLGLLAVIFITVKLASSLFNSIAFRRRAKQLGCGEGVSFPHKDPILGLDLFFETLGALKRNQLPELFSERFDRYGETFWQLALGKWMVQTSEPENVKTILGTNMDDWPIAGPRLDAVVPVLGKKSIFTSNGKDWHEARAMIRPSFVRDQVADLEAFQSHVENLLRAIPKDGSTFDLQELLMAMTMDSSTDFMLGYSTNSLVKPSAEAKRFLKDFEYASFEAAKIGRLGSLLLMLPHRELYASVRRLREYVRFYLKETIDARAASKQEKEKSGGEDGKKKGYVFLDELLNAGASGEYLVDQILSVLIAGRDTTAASLTAVFYFLARHPDCVVKLRKEIDDLGVENPSWEQLKQMKYLNNVIREALRLFPPLSTNSRACNKDTVLPRGGGPDGKQPILIPKGTQVRYSSYRLHRRKDIYGLDADEFRPERWENLRVVWEYIPFSGGPRICLGQQFALTQMAYTVFKFFQTFKAIEAREQGPLQSQTNLTVSFANGCLVAVTPV